MRVFYLDDPDVMDTLIVDEAAFVTVNPYAEETLFTFNNFKGDTLILRVEDIKPKSALYRKSAVANGCSTILALGKQHLTQCAW
jgi:hypothetical protein